MTPRKGAARVHNPQRRRQLGSVSRCHSLADRWRRTALPCQCSADRTPAATKQEGAPAGEALMFWDGAFVGEKIFALWCLLAGFNVVELVISFYIL